MCRAADQQRGRHADSEPTPAGCRAIWGARHRKCRNRCHLTHLLQLFHEKGLMDHLSFKGGTILRKMVFGPRGQLASAAPGALLLRDYHW